MTQSADESTGLPQMVIATIKGTTVTTRTLSGMPGSQFVTAADGSVLLTVITYGNDGTEYSIARLTPTGITSSVSTAGSPQSWPQAAGDGTVYLAGLGATAAQLTVLSPGGASKVVELPGEFIDGAVPVLGIMAVGPDNRAYVPLQVENGIVIAVVGPNGVQSVRALDGFPTQPPVFAPDGTAYQVVETADPETGARSTHVVVVATGASTTAVPGSVAQVQGLLPAVAAGPDGTGLPRGRRTRTGRFAGWPSTVPARRSDPSPTTAPSRPRSNWAACKVSPVRSSCSDRTAQRM